MEASARELLEKASAALFNTGAGALILADKYAEAGEPEGEAMWRKAAWQSRDAYQAIDAALSAAPEASGWVAVTDDPATWVPVDILGPILVECRATLGSDESFRDTFDEAHDARAACKPDVPGRVIRWMPWPALAVSAAAGRKEGK